MEMGTRINQILINYNRLVLVRFKSPLLQKAGAIFEKTCR